MSRHNGGEQHTPMVRVPAGFEAEFPGASALATECFMNFGVVAGTVEAGMVQLLASHGVPSLGAFNVLTIVDGAGEPLRPSVVAARMVVSRPTVTGLLDTLEGRGLVTRRGHAGDKRAKAVALTPAGRRLVRRLLPLIHDFERRVMAGLDRTQLETLLGILATLEHHVGSVLDDVPLGVAERRRGYRR